MLEPGEKMPNDRCGFVLQPDQIEENPDEWIVTPRHRDDSRDWAETYSIATCIREPWQNGRCIWHADTEAKPVGELRNARATGPECFDGAVLNNTEWSSAISFDNCSLVGSRWKRASCRGITFNGTDIRHAEFSDGSFREAEVRNSDFRHGTCHEAKFRDADFSGSDLSETEFSRSTLTGSSFSDATLRDSKFNNAVLLETEFQNTNTKYADLSNSSLQDAIFHHADSKYTDFSASSLRNAEFNDADLLNAQFSKTSLLLAKFPNAQLTGADFREAEVRDVQFSDATLDRASFHDTDLTGTEFPNASLRQAHFHNSTMDLVNLYSTNLTDATVEQSDLQQANLARSNLEDAQLPDSDLREVTLERAHLRDAVLDETDLRGTNLRGAELYQTVLKDVRIDNETNFGDRTPYRNPRFHTQIEVDKNDQTNPLLAAAWVNRRLEALHEDNAMSDTASHHHIQKEEAERDLARESAFSGYSVVSRGDFGRWSVKTAMRYLTNHGESVKYVLGWWVAVIGVSALLFPWVGGIKDNSGNVYALTSLSELGSFAGWNEWGLNLYFSVITFSTIGYGDLSPASPLSRVLVGIESIAGALLLALLVFVLGRRVAR